MNSLGIKTFSKPFDSGLGVITFHATLGNSSRIKFTILRNRPKLSFDRFQEILMRCSFCTRRRYLAEMFATHSAANHDTFCCEICNLLFDRMVDFYNESRIPALRGLSQTDFLKNSTRRAAIALCTQNARRPILVAWLALGHFLPNELVQLTIYYLSAVMAAELFLDVIDFVQPGPH